MNIRRFEVNVPNPGPGTALIDLSLETGSPDELVALGFPTSEPLKVRDAGITLDPCADTGEGRLDLKLEPRASATVYVVVDVVGGQGAALLHLVDRREDQVGGVMLACFEGIDADPPGTTIFPERPCPIQFAGPLYACTETDATHEDPDGIVLGGWSWLAVPLVNPTADAEGEAYAYLEHLGGADGEFEPGTWQLGDFAPGERFLAVWRVRIDSASAPFRPCVVVGSAKTDPVRLTGEAAFWEKRPWEGDRAVVFTEATVRPPRGRRRKS
jgi:hypothetical protein